MVLDNFRTIELIWDKANKSIIKSIKTASSDTTGRYLSVKVLDGGQEVTLNGASLQLYWEHPNFNTRGTDNFNTLNNSGLFQMTFSKEMLTNVGELNAHLVLTLADGKITSDVFKIQVIKGSSSGVVIPSNGENAAIQALYEAMEKLNNFDGGPSIFMNTLSELQATYPNGAPGVALVRETDPAKIYVWNGSAWEDFGDYQGISIANKTVVPSKTTFYQVDINTTLTPNSYISHSSGKVVSIQNNYHSSDFIPFDYIGVPMLINTNNANDSSGLAFYDNDKKYITGIQTGGNKSGFDETRFIAPKNTAYIRFTIIGASEISNFYIIFADDTYKLIESMQEKYSFITQFVPLDFESNFYWTRSGNKVAHNSKNYGVSSMEVSKGETYRISGRVAGIDKLYVLENEQGVVIDYFPEATTAEVFYDVEFKIPEDGLLKIGKYSMDTTLQVLPLFRLDKQISETKAVNREYLKHLLLSTLLIGDSITRGAYYSPENNGRSVAENYPYYLGKMTGWSTTNAGVSGITTSGWFDNESNKYDYSTFDTVVINLGTNGGLTDTLEADTSFGSYSQYADTNTGSYCKIIEKIKEQNPNMFIFITNVTSTSGDLEITNNVIKQIANKYNLPVIDLMHLKGDPIIHPFGNNVHYGKVGNIELAKTVLDGITGDIEKNPSKYELLLL